MTEINEKELNEFMDNLVKSFIESERDFKGEYALNKQQYEKFNKVCDYMAGLAEECEGKITMLDCKPQSLCGLIEIEIDGLNLVHNKYKEFLDVMSNADVLGITPTIRETVYIGANINHVWERVIINE